MVFRVFAVLLGLNLLFAAAKSGAVTPEGDVRLTAGSYATAAQADADGTGLPRDAARKLTSYILSYLLDQVTDTIHATKRVSTSDLRSGPSDQMIRSKPVQFLLDSNYAIDVRKNGATLHWSYQF